jgi:hypothetical protein
MEQHTPAHPPRPLSVVVESDDAALAICDFIAFASAGFDVVVCSGPGEGRHCQAIEGEPCPLAGDADVVLNAIRDPEVQRRVAAAVRATSPDVPMVVCTHDDEGLPEGCVPLVPTSSIAGQTAALRRAVFNSLSR